MPGGTVLRLSNWRLATFIPARARAGLSGRFPIHDLRHTAASLMKAGVPVSIISAWAGHYSGAFTMATYVHASPEDLAAGRDALAAIYRAEET